MRPLPPTLRLLGCGVVLAVLVALGAVLVPADRAPRAPEPVAAQDRTGPITVLRAWDRARAEAWRRGDLRALEALYVAGSSAARADTELLAAYLERGLRVSGLRMQVASVQVLASGGGRISLRVTDRLAGATVRGAGQVHPLPQDRWSRRLVVLVRTGERWQVAEVTDQVRPEARTAATSGSENS